MSEQQKERDAAIAKKQEEHISAMDAVTRRLYANKKRGKKFLQKGIDTLIQRMKFAEFLR